MESDAAVAAAGAGLTPFSGEVCIVTGGSTGIGAAACKAFKEGGAKVYNVDLNAQAHDDAVFRQCDVSQIPELKACFAAIIEENEGEVHHLISNAAVWHADAFENVTEETFDRVVAINVKGAFFGIQAVLPAMRKVGRGNIIITCSDQTLVGKPEQNVYGLTKGALGQLVKSCGAQFAPEHIRVNGVCPGTIDTPLMHGAVSRFSSWKEEAKEGLYKWLETAQPYPRLGRPEEVAKTMVMISQVDFMVGALVPVDGGYTCQ